MTMANLHATIAGINNDFHESPYGYIVAIVAILIVGVAIGYPFTPSSVKGKHLCDLANKDRELKHKDELHETDLAEKDYQIAEKWATVRRYEDVAQHMFKVAGWIHELDPAVRATGIDLCGLTTNNGTLNLVLQDPDQPAVYLYLTFANFESEREIDQKVTLTIGFVEGKHKEHDGRSLDLELRFNESPSHPGMGYGYYHSFTDGGKIKLQDMLGRARILRDSGPEGFPVNTTVEDLSAIADSEA